MSRRHHSMRVTSRFRQVTVLFIGLKDGIREFGDSYPECRRLPISVGPFSIHGDRITITNYRDGLSTARKYSPVDEGKHATEGVAARRAGDQSSGAPSGTMSRCTVYSLR